MSQAVHNIAAWLRTARRICVSTGAGMSAESGVPTFRDASGLWSTFNVAELATPQGFARDPRKVWAWYRWRRQELARCRPHSGHELLARWERRIERFDVVTQNIDGLHHVAGSHRVIELHGRLDRARCVACSHVEVGLHDLGEDPRCPACQARLRPDVVWFGEALPEAAIAAAFAAAEECDLLLVIGTSGVVQPAASLVDTAKAAGAKIVEINPHESEHSPLADEILRSGCGAALEALERAWQEPRA